MPTHQQSRLRRTALSLALPGVLLAAAIAGLSVSSANAAPLPTWKYVQEVNQALPDGMTSSNATPEAYQAAVQKVILAHPASDAPAIAAALATGAPLAQGKAIADAIGKLFPTHPDLAARAVEIARAITIALDGKLQKRESDYKDASEAVPLTPDMVATEIGNVAAILAYNLDPSNPANQAAIVQLIQGVVLVNPQVDYTAKIVEIFSGTLTSLGVPDSVLDAVEDGVLDVVSDPVIRQQIRAALVKLKSDEVMFPPGMIILHETPVTNG